MLPDEPNSDPTEESNFSDTTRVETAGHGDDRPIVILPIELRVLDQAELDEEFDEDEMEDGPRTVLITGACGNIGSKLRATLGENYDLVLIDLYARPDDEEVIVADLAEWDESWVSQFEDVDTVIHLAGNPDEFSSWDDLVQPNLDALANVLNAAAYGGVERVIFASSNHAMGGYRDLGDMPITVDLPPKPDGPYGSLKLVGERLGRSLAAAFDLTFIALRLGWVQSGDNLPKTLPDEWSRLLWLSNNDLTHLVECAIEADLSDRNFLVVNGMSNNQGMRWDLSETVEWLGYEPEDDSGAEAI